MDPSQGVPPQLISHVHCISSQRYPFIARMPINQAFSYLFEAPKVIGQSATMSWQYLNAPHDGSIFLMWMSPRVKDDFPTDGYIWAGHEERSLAEFGGYTVETATQRCGYAPGRENIACHSRTRYRLIAKDPTVNAGPPDPHLWVVHYGPAQQSIPINQIQITPLQQQQLQARQLIEAQGRLERQEFMLHDRNKWPMVKFVPRNMQPGTMYGQTPYGPQTPATSMANPRFSGQYYQQGQQGVGGPSPAKRQRPNPPAQLPPAAAAAVIAQQQQQDPTIEIEEDVTVGDYLDLLTQRDISLTRYMQHHEWMEEVFSSPYATGNIIPADLGFGLMGELAGLTDGIFEALVMGQEKALAESEETGHIKLQSEQVQTFEKRVKEYMDDGQAELQRMREEHAKKMNEFRRSKKLLQAEKKLRGGLGDDGKAQVNGHGGQVDEDEVAKEVEGLLGVHIVLQRESRTVDKGGLRERIVQQPIEVNGRTGRDEMDVTLSNGEAGQRLADTNQNGAATITAAQAPEQPSVLATTEQSVPPADQGAKQELAALPQQDGSAEQPQQPEQTIGNMADDDNLGTLDEDNFQIEGMDLDMGDDTNFDFDDSTAGQVVSGVPQQMQAPGQAAPPPNPAAPVAQAATQSTQQPGQPGQPELYSMAGEQGASFDDFTTGDGLIDFEGGDGQDLDLDLSMDTSAFGDAFHETEGGDDGAGDVQ